MTSDENRVSDDKLREIIDGCEGVTPGPWRPLNVLNSHYVMSDTETFDFGGPHRQHVALMTKNYGVDTSSVRDKREQTNAAHIARLDPQTAAAICSELLSRRSQQEPVAWRWRLQHGAKPADHWYYSEAEPSFSPHDRANNVKDLTPLYASPQTVGVGVKGLEWREVAWRDGLETRKEPFWWKAEWPGDRWIIGAEDAGFEVRYNHGQGRGDARISIHETLGEAKAAAQADYEQRILAALEPRASDREAVVCSVKTMKLSDGREDHYVSIMVGDREITPHMYRVKGRAEFDVANWQWLFNGGEKPRMLDWLDRTRDPSDPTEAAIRKLSEVSHEH